MRKVLFVLLIFSFALTACTEEEAQLRFSTQEIVNPDNIQLIYESPDPMHCAKKYRIISGYESCSITLRCTNANNIYIINDEQHPTYYNDSYGQWSAEIISPNTVRITFDKIDTTPEDEADDAPVRYNFLTIGSNTKKGKQSESISILRFQDFTS